MLDVLSGPADDEASLNHYLKPSSNRVGFVSQAIANVISHEIGHLIGNFHTDNLDAHHSLMDSGGANFQNLFGTGPDRIGGTADDEDVDFVTDTYAPAEGFGGQENTLNVAAWAFAKARPCRDVGAGLHLPTEAATHRRQDGHVLVVRGPVQAIDELVVSLVGAGVAIRGLAPVVPPLEAAFLALMGDGDELASAAEDPAAAVA